MSDPKIETIQNLYAAFGAGDIETILGLVADDVNWGSEPEGTAPWHGIHHGKGEVPNFFKSIGEELEVTDFTPLAFASSDTDVMAVVRFGMKVRSTGKSSVMDLHHWFRFDADGKIDQYRGTEDTALTYELLAP